MSVVLKWVHDVTKPESRTVVVTLGEAETLRRIIQARNRGGDEGKIASLLPETAGIALVAVSTGMIIDCTSNYPADAGNPAAFLAIRFWNNEMSVI